MQGFSFYSILMIIMTMNILLEFVDFIHIIPDLIIIIPITQTIIGIPIIHIIGVQIYM